MFKKIPYRKLVKFLPWMLAFLFLLIYWFAISETLKLRHETINLGTEASAIEKAPKEMSDLKRKIEEINKAAGKNSVTGTDPLMELTSNLVSKHQVILSEYKPLHIFNYQNYSIETRVISFEAPFIPCLKLLSDMETSYRSGKIVSVNYTSQIDNKTQKRHLYMQLLIQAIQNGKNKEQESASIQ